MVFSLPSDMTNRNLYLKPFIPNHKYTFVQYLSIVIQIPAPETLLQITWTLIGFMFARSFKNIDHFIKESEWYAALDKLGQFLVGGILDFFHHFWMGLLIMIYYPQPQECYWFGYGLFLDDLPDIPARFRKYFDYLFNGNGTE